MTPESWHEHMRNYLYDQGSWSGIVPWAPEAEAPVRKPSGVVRTISHVKRLFEGHH